MYKFYEYIIETNNPKYNSLMSSNIINIYS